MPKRTEYAPSGGATHSHWAYALPGIPKSGFAPRRKPRRYKMRSNQEKSNRTIRHQVISSFYYPNESSVAYEFANVNPKTNRDIRAERYKKIPLLQGVF